VFQKRPVKNLHFQKKTVEVLLIYISVPFLASEMDLKRGIVEAVKQLRTWIASLSGRRNTIQSSFLITTFSFRLISANRRQFPPPLITLHSRASALNYLTKHINLQTHFSMRNN